jgi:hypothetical protein
MRPILRAINKRATCELPAAYKRLRLIAFKRWGMPPVATLASGKHMMAQSLGLWQFHMTRRTIDRPNTPEIEQRCGHRSYHGDHCYAVVYYKKLWQGVRQVCQMESFLGTPPLP